MIVSGVMRCQRPIVVTAPVSPVQMSLWALQASAVHWQTFGRALSRHNLHMLRAINEVAGSCEHSMRV